MDVSAHLLPCFGGSEHADDGDFGELCTLFEVVIFAQLGIISGGCGLVVVDAVESHAEHVHFDVFDELVDSRRRTAGRERRSLWLVYPKHPLCTWG